MGQDGPADGSDRDGQPTARWPARLRGVTETVVTTLGPNDRWNVAALGVEAPTSRGTDGGSDRRDPPASGAGMEPPATARTWGRTRTRRNFEARGAAHVQFTDDPVDFVEAALTVRETDEPVLESAVAWARVTAERLDAGTEAGTEWVDWALRPVESVVREGRVPTINRGFNAVVEATVVASRLDVAAYDTGRQRERLGRHLELVRRCGGPAERTAADRLEAALDR